MNELSLFSGAGGGLLGTKLLGFRCIGYIENNPYCQKILKARIADGILDEAPIFGDIRKFLANGFAGTFDGLVDVITAGFPCQPFSIAGRGLAENDPRNMWPETLACIRTIKPRYALLENVPGLIGKPYFRRILREIAESGYDLRWRVLGASDIGANHRRKRLWILAYPKSEQGGRVQQSELQSHIATGCCNVANPEHGRISKRRRAKSTSKEMQELGGVSGNDAAARCVEEKQILANSNSPGFPDYCGSEEGTKRSRLGAISYSGWWDSEPDVGRVAHGVAHRVDRLKALGNGQVPLCMAYAFQKLSEGIIE